MSGRLHRALADHVRALHGQSLFDRFNEPAPPPPLTDLHHNLSHSSSALASTTGRRVHTIPIRVEGRSRPASCPPVSTASRPQQQQQPPPRVYEIPVNVVSAPQSTKDKAVTSDQTSSQTAMFNTADDAERKLASLMSQLETEISSSSAGITGSTPHTHRIHIPAESAVKSPPPYHGPHITEFYRQPSAHLASEGATRPMTGVISATEPGLPVSPPVTRGTTPGTTPVSPGTSLGTSVGTVAVDVQTAASAERYGELFL